MGKVVFDKLLGKPLLHTHDPLYLTDSDGVVWVLTVATDGTLVTNLLPGPSGTAGSPMGLLLTLTYPV